MPRLAELHERLDPARAHPQTVGGARRHRDVEHGHPRRRVVEVERQLVVGAELVVEIDEPGDVERRQLRRRSTGRRAARRTGPALATGVVDEHDLAVGREAGVRLEARGPVLERPPEERERVLAVRRPCRPGGQR